MSDTCYVDKKHYDALLSAFGRLKVESSNLKKAWADLKTKTAQFDDHVLEDIHRFDTIVEVNAYLTGIFRTMMAIEHDVKELEEKYNVEIGK